MSKHPSDEEFRHPLCCDLLRAGYEEGCLGTVMVSDGENQVVFLGLREFDDKIEGNNFEWIHLQLREYWCQQSLGGSSVDFMALALRTPSNILYHVLPESRPPVLSLDQVCSLTNSWVTMYR